MKRDIKGNKRNDVKEIIEMMSRNNTRLINSLTVQRKSENILTKPNNPPIWGQVDYKRYEGQVNYWNQDSKDLDISKFNLLMNELNKKKYILGSVMKVIHDRTHMEGRTVTKILQVLR